MVSTRDIPWLRIAAESAAVVVSILFAFAIDAWWEERLERKLEREELTRLYEEFETNRDRLMDWEPRYKNIDAARLLSELVEDALTADQNSVDAPTHFVRQILGTPTFEAETPILEGLVRSGKLSIITDTRVLTSISVWDRTYRNYFDQAVQGRQVVVAHLIPGLRTRGSIAGVLQSFTEGPTDFEAESDVESTLEIDQELVALLARRYENQWRISRTLSQTREAADDVLVAISSALDQ